MDLIIIKPVTMVITVAVPINQRHIVVFFRHLFKHRIHVILPALRRYSDIDPLYLSITDCIHHTIKLSFRE